MTPLAKLWSATVGTSIVPLFEEPSFRALWSGVMLATVGAVMLLVALSYQIYIDTGSALGAALIFGTRWVVALVMLPVIAKAAAVLETRRLIAGTQIALGVTGVVFLVAPPSLSAFFIAILCVRGFIDVLLKSVYVVALKVWIPPEKLEASASFFDTSVYIGGAVGALLAPLVLEIGGLPAVILLTAVIYGLAAIIILSLPRRAAAPPPPGPTRPWRDTMALAKTSPRLFLTLMLLVAATCLFQGYHDASRIVLPLAHLGLGDMGLGVFQAMTSIAFLAGALVATHFAGPDRTHWFIAERPLIIATAIAMGLPIVTREPVVAFTTYAAFIILYEVLFIVLARRLVVESSVTEIPVVASVRTVLSGAGLAVGTLFVGLLNDEIGLVAATLAVLVSSVVVLQAIEVMLKKTPR